MIKIRPAIGLLALLLITGQAHAPEILLKFSHFLGPKSFFQADLVEPWARDLEARTGGKVKVETFDGTSPV